MHGREFIDLYTYVRDIYKGEVVLPYVSYMIHCIIYDTFSFLNFCDLWWLIKPSLDKQSKMERLFQLPNILTHYLAVKLDLQVNILVTAPKKQNVAYLIHRALEG